MFTWGGTYLLEISSAIAWTSNLSSNQSYTLPILESYKNLNTVKHKFILLFIIEKSESGIRTHGICKDSSDFKSDAIDQLCHLA